MLYFFFKNIVYLDIRNLFLRFIENNFTFSFLLLAFLGLILLLVRITSRLFIFCSLSKQFFFCEWRSQSFYGHSTISFFLRGKAVSHFSFCGYLLLCQETTQTTNKKLWGEGGGYKDMRFFSLNNFDHIGSRTVCIVRELVQRWCSSFTDLWRLYCCFFWQIAVCLSGGTHVRWMVVRAWGGNACL